VNAMNDFPGLLCYSLLRLRRCRCSRSW